MPKLTLFNIAKVVLLLIASPMLVFATISEDSNICNIGEFWGSLCLTTAQWEAGWYLHPDNDPGDGQAVDIAYGNYSGVIVHMPHSMCIDWRSANCDGTIPPPAPAPDEPKTVSRKFANTAAECIAQANTKPGIDPYCRSLLDYVVVAMDHGDYDAKLHAERQAFEDGIMDPASCPSAEASIAALGAGFTAGTLNDAETEEILLAIETVQTWACVTYYNRSPPTIPDPPA